MITDQTQGWRKRAPQALRARTRHTKSFCLKLFCLKTRMLPRRGLQRDLDRIIWDRRSSDGDGAAMITDQTRRPEDASYSYPPARTRRTKSFCLKLFCLKTRMLPRRGLRRDLDRIIWDRRSSDGDGAAMITDQTRRPEDASSSSARTRMRRTELFCIPSCKHSPFCSSGECWVAGES